MIDFAVGLAVFICAVVILARVIVGDWPLGIYRVATGRTPWYHINGGLQRNIEALQKWHELNPSGVKMAYDGREYHGPISPINPGSVSFQVPDLVEHVATRMAAGAEAVRVELPEEVWEEVPEEVIGYVMGVGVNKVYAVTTDGLKLVKEG